MNRNKYKYPESDCSHSINAGFRYWNSDSNSQGRDEWFNRCRCECTRRREANEQTFPWCGKCCSQAQSCHVFSTLMMLFSIHLQLQVSESYGLRFPREFALLMKQLLYFDRYTRLLAPNMNMLQDQRISIVSNRRNK